MRTTLPALTLAALPAIAQPVVLEDAKLLAPDGAPYDCFGGEVAISGGLVLVGAQFDDDQGESSGSAYLFNAATGTLHAKLVAHDSTSGRQFGAAVAIDGAQAVVSAPRHGPVINPPGRAYMFNAGTGVERFSDRGSVGDILGRSAAVDGVTAAVGAIFARDDDDFQTGSVFVYDLESGDLVREIFADDRIPNDQFGTTVAMDGSTLAVGAVNKWDGQSNPGAAYLFDVKTGTQLHTLSAPDAEHEDSFGISVAIEGGVVAVGAQRDDDVATNAGAVYLFDADSGALRRKLTASDGAQQDLFGRSVALIDGLVIVGANFADTDGDDSGAAYVFNAHTGEQLAKLLPSDGAAGALFGISLSADAGTLCVGSYLGRNDAGDPTGAAYLYDLTKCNGADLAFPRRTLNLDDLGAFAASFAAEDPAADCTADGLFTIADVACFVDAFLAGCP